MISFLVGFIGLATVSCTIQWAMKNKNTDCGFTNDKVHPHGRKDPMTFYGDSKPNK